MKTFLLLYKSRVLTTIAGLLTLVSIVQLQKPTGTTFPALMDAYYLSLPDVPHSRKEKEERYPFDMRVFTPEKPINLFRKNNFSYHFAEFYQRNDNIYFRHRQDFIYEKRMNVYRRHNIGHFLGVSYICIRLENDQKTPKYLKTLHDRENGILIYDQSDDSNFLVHTFEVMTYKYYRLQKGDLIIRVADIFIRDDIALAKVIQILDKHAQRTNQDEAIKLRIITINGEEKEVFVFPNGKEGEKYLVPEK